MHVLRWYSDVVQDPSDKMDLTLLFAISKYRPMRQITFLGLSDPVAWQ